MNSKTHRLNHDFQIAYFLAGSCHTADGAYALLCDLAEDREAALGQVRAMRLRNQAVRIKYEELVRNEGAPESRVKEAQAEVAEIAAREPSVERDIAAAHAELETIRRCIDKIQPLRKFAHLPDAEAHEAAQADEWAGELVRRIQNEMLTTGTVNVETFATARLHPQFKERIAPEMISLRRLLELGQIEEAVQQLSGPPSFLPLLLASEPTE